VKSPTLAAAFALVTAGAIAACTNGGGLGSINSGGGGPTPSPPPSNGIGVGIPTGTIGVEDDPVWGTVSGYTQNKTSQVLAYPPGATVAVTNLSSTSPHTLNVIGVASSPPPNWPKNPSLSFYPSGNGVIGSNYASGTINPGKSVKIKLTNPGTYLIGCAFHYIEFSMRDVIEVVAGATPGPTASPGSGGYARPAPRSRPNASKAPHEPQLIDQQGHSFSLSSLRGKPLAVTFIAAHCTDACPLVNAQFQQAAEQMRHRHLEGRLLTITLDPEHDSPHDMAVLAHRFNADPRYWIVAGGSKSNVHKIMRAFDVISEEGKHGYHDRHSTFVYAFNSSGELAQTMLASTALDDDLVAAFADRRWITQR
jgi:cytochrome oxidase Cu insertion factor (SCO1/SenC/PrrC family)